MNNDMVDVGELDPANGAMLEQLRDRSSRYGSIPNIIHQGALAAFEWRSMDEDLATLLSDSADSDRLVGARTTLSGMRLLEFVSGATHISLGLSDSGVMTGTILGGPGQTAFLVSGAGQRIALIVDDFGEFVCGEIPPGPVRLELGIGPGRTVTDWVLPPIS